MTKRSDMASRYAAAHARREQRRTSSARQYLPLAEEIISPSGTGTSTMISSRLPSMNYSYLRKDLLRIFVLTVSLFALLIILSFVVHV